MQKSVKQGDELRKRNCRVEVRFANDELSDLRIKAKKAGLSLGGFIRKAVQEKPVREAPPAEYYELIREVRRSGTNINQIAKAINGKGIFNATELREALRSNRAVEEMLWKSFAVDK